MEKLERWLITIAFVFSVIPFILVTLFIKVLPQDVIIFDDKSTYDPLIVGILCVIPLAIVIGVRLVKAKLVVKKSMVASLSVSILLSATFSVVVIFAMMQQISDVRELLEEFQTLESVDILGLISIVLCLVLSLYGNTLRTKEKGDRLAIKNKYTTNSPVVFRVVHRTASPVITVISAFTAVVLAFFDGWQTLIVPIVVVILFYAWTYYYSYAINKRILKRALRFTDEE